MDSIIFHGWSRRRRSAPLNLFQVDGLRSSEAGAVPGGTVLTTSW